MRRRLAWIGALGVLAGIVATVIALIPGTSPSTPAPVGDEGPAQLAAAPVRQRITAADRRNINATLDRFVPAAVARRSATTAWALAGPELKASSTLAQWRAGNSPVPYYPAKGTSVHDWTTIEVARNSVILNLLVHPKPGSKLGDYVFSGQVVRHGSGWLVNRWYTIAVMSPVRGTTHEVGPADFKAPSASGGPPPGTPSLGRAWLLPVVGALALVLLLPLVLGLAAVVRAVRWRRRVDAEERRQLPPLPSTLRER